MMHASLSDSNIADQASGEQTTPPCYVFQRQKRSREHEFEDEFNTFKDEMRNMITSLFEAQKSELENMVTSQIGQTNKSIQECLGFLTAQNEELKKKLEQFEIQSRKDKDHITILEDKIEDLQRVNGKTTIELKNVPLIASESKEDLTKMVTCLSKNVHCEVKREDIRDIYRKRGKRNSDKNSPIVVELSSTLLKTDILKMCKLFNIKNKEKLQAPRSHQKRINPHLCVRTINRSRRSNTLHCP